MMVNNLHSGVVVVGGAVLVCDSVVVMGVVGVVVVVSEIVSYDVYWSKVLTKQTRMMSIFQETVHNLFSEKVTVLVKKWKVPYQYTRLQFDHY